MTISPQRVIWQQQHVVDVRDAAFAARTYREHKDVRGLLNKAVGGQPLQTACEIGSGFGRMTVVPTEFADQVTGFEREVHFVEEASSLLPGINFIQVASLAKLPCEDVSMDLIMTFTVLQHLTEPVVQATAKEILRMLRPGGHLLICEETDPSHVDGAVNDPNGMCTIGRTVAQYQQFFPSLELLATQRRRIEPTYPRDDVGTYMLFRKS